MLFFALVLTAASIPITYIPMTKTPPSPRLSLVLDYHSPSNSIILFSGLTESLAVNDIWAFSLTSNQWSKYNPLSLSLPAPRRNSGGFASRFSNSFYIFGGVTELGPQGDLWMFNLDFLLWSQLNPGNPPSPRQNFAFTSFVKDNHECFVVFGGSMTTQDDNRLYILNLTSFQWSIMPQNGELPPPSHGSSMFYYNQSLYIVAGTTFGTKPENSPVGLFRYSLQDRLWQNLSSEITYSQRSNSAAVVINDVAYLIYGWSDIDGKNVDSIMKVSLTDKKFQWTEITIPIEISPISSFGSVVQDSNIVIFGGYLTNGLMSNWLVQATMEPFSVKSLSDQFIGPAARQMHSLTQINSKFYLFGGKDQENFYNDLWAFDPTTETWDSVSTTGSIPSARCSHAADSEGDAIAIWGGEGSLGLTNDLFLFNALNKNWLQLTPVIDLAPTPAKGACLVLRLPHVYIYGGYTLTGYSGTFWEYNLWDDTYKIISSDNELAYATCSLYNGEFYVMLGTTTSAVSVNVTRKYNFDDKTWVTVQSLDVYTKSSQGIQVFYDGSLIKIGGQTWNTNPMNKVFVISNSTVSDRGSIEEFTYNSAFVYFNLSIYSFGGAEVAGGSLRTEIPHNRLFSLKITDICDGKVCTVQCSKGTYANQGVCTLCPTGSYSALLGNSTCELCPQGTFNRERGSDIDRQCYPCTEGSFSEFNGSALCIECPVGLFCPAGTAIPMNFSSASIEGSIQPKLYSSPFKSSTIFYYELFFGISMLCIIVSLVSFYRSRKYIKFFDLYTNAHNIDINKPMTLTRSLIGGIFTLIFIALAGILIGTTMISYDNDNIIETKALVPLVVLQDEVKEFLAKTFTVTAKFMSYGDKCVDGAGECSTDIAITEEYIISDASSYKCWMDEQRNCYIQYTFTNCIIQKGANIILALQEKKSYSSGISINITSDSSIPNEISADSYSVNSDKNYILVGSTASEFFFSITPSYFKSDASEWQSYSTGYHVSTEFIPLIGSQHLNIDLAVASQVKVVINIDISNTSLFTYRYYKQTFVFILSSLVGSVFGIMGAVSWIMKIFEKQFRNLYRKTKLNKNRDETIKLRKELKGCTKKCDDAHEESSENDIDQYKRILPSNEPYSTR